VPSEKIKNVIEWNKIEKGLSKFDKSYVKPIKDIDITYSDKYKEFTYVIIQAKNKQTIVNKTSPYSGHYQLNKLIINATNGDVLEKTKAGYSYTSNPSW